ncbi:hypothetical protein [Kribbella italica]|uniref:Uncharacterized protein n=1 Tax=Kribbella italica TaxID=1540520 RepID=A0A7W9JAQ6_9ACTN|nr:hypothetical protein [Kribbella italica]MBB5838702.1 hypothetical protein [Kribbella italica]
MKDGFVDAHLRNQIESTYERRLHGLLNDPNATSEDFDALNSWQSKAIEDLNSRPKVAAAPVPPPAPVPPNIGLEDLDLGVTAPSAAAQAVNDACNSLSIAEVYSKISKNRWKRPYQGEIREGIKISCPNPNHPDEHPSAWLNTITNKYHCGTCWQGGYIYEMAALAWGMQLPMDLFRIKCRLAKELRGVDYDALRADRAEANLNSWVKFLGSGS